ncbi:unnamed protein product, partial [Chrysoparadoxa australica]
MNGRIQYALRDLTGGYVSTIQWKVKKGEGGVNDTLEVKGEGIKRYGWLKEQLKSRIESGEMVGCEVEAGQGPLTLRQGDHHHYGLLEGKTYSVLEVFQRDREILVKLKNPWGKGKFTGDWCEGSVRWSQRPDIASELLPKTEPGAFWMCLDDVHSVFSTLYAVLLLEGPGSSFARCDSRLHGVEGGLNGNAQWTRETQYFIEVAATDLVGPDNNILTPELVVSITSEDDRYQGRDYRAQSHGTRGIGVALCHHKWPKTSADTRKVYHLTEESCLHVSQPFIRGRDVSFRLGIEPGQYALVVVPHSKGEAGERYWVNAWSSAPVEMTQ